MRVASRAYFSMFLFVLKVCFVYFDFIGYDEEIREDFANFTALLAVSPCYVSFRLKN